MCKLEIKLNGFIFVTNFSTTTTKKRCRKYSKIHKSQCQIPQTSSTAYQSMSEVLETVKPAISGMFIQWCRSGKIQGNMFSNYEALWEDGCVKENKKIEWGWWVTIPSWTPQLSGKLLVYASLSAHERAWTLNNPVITTDIDDLTDHQSHTQLITCW